MRNIKTFKPREKQGKVLANNVASVILIFKY